MICRSSPCKYHGFLFFMDWCRHPDANAEIANKPARCKRFVDWEKRVMPGQEPPWPTPVVFTQLIAVLAAVLLFRKEDAGGR